MANSVATLVVQTELLPSQAPSSLSPFPSLLPSVEEEDNDDGKRADEEKTPGSVVLAGVEMVTSSTSPGTAGSQTSEHPFQCLDCGKSFKWSSRLAHHQRSHNNERPYRCNLCPKAFKGSSALLYHQRSHSGEKPYKCEDCGKAFKRSSLLQVHRSVHTGLRTFQCPYCPLTFKWSSHYQYHLRQHTGECPYPCDRCPKAFKNSSSLRRHKNVHLGVKPYVCMVCSKAFSQSTNLRQHMRIHTGERPYICSECGRSFTHSSNLALHRNSHVEVKTQDGKTGKVGAQANVEVVLERATSNDLKAVEMTISDMVGLVGGPDGGTGQVFLSHHVPSACPSSSAERSPNVLPGSEHVQVSMEESAETGANVLLYSCGSCHETFGTQTHLEEHQALHLHSLGAGNGVEDIRGDGIEAQGGGVSLVGMAPLLADFEEVVETTTVSESAQGSELLGLGGIGGGSGQVQYDLLQSFTSSVTQMPSDDTASIVDTTVATLSECAFCGKSFKSSSSMSRHMAQVHPLALSQSKSQFNCSVCDRSFPLLSSLLSHQLSHTEEQRLLAEAEAEIVCPPSLSLSLPLSSSTSAKREGEEEEDEEGEREIHVSLIAVTEEGEKQTVKAANRTTGKGGRRGGRSKSSAANNERPYRCIECGKSFKGSSGLRYHMRDHTGERPYRCTECGKSFKRSSLLSIHQRVHTGVRAFQCPYCTLTFKWSSHFQYHLRQHTGERPYVCQECGKSFKNTSCLRRHSQLHSGLRPHACSVCGRKFSQTSNLKQHERTHSGERPFQCAQCHKTFTHSSNLQLHVRTHSSRKDYKCQHCGKEFTVHSYLQRHLQTHSGAGGGATCTKDAGKAAKSGGGTSEASGATLNLNVNPAGGLSSLFSNEGNSTLILSPSNLDIPPNTSQNYFMIQTPTGLQLIPLSNPTPTQPVLVPPPPPPPPPPPLPPPPPPSQNFLLLQCQSTNGSQPSLILVPTTSGTNALAAPSAPRPLPLVQTIPALPQIATLASAQTQISAFQPLQTQQRFIFTNNNTPLVPAPAQNTTVTRPILGTLSPNRSPRTRRGRRNKTQKSGSLEQTPPSVTSTQGLVPSSTISTTTATATVALPTTLSRQPNVLTPVPPLNSDPAPDAPTTPAPDTVTATKPLTNSQCHLPSDHPSSSIADEVEKTPEPLSENRFVLCFEKESEEREQGGEMEVKVAMNEGVEGERSYVLHFERESEQGEEGGEERGEKSYILRFQSGEELQGDGEKDKAGMVSLNLLQEWSGGGGESQRMEGFGDGVGVEEKAFVLHFQEDDPNDDDDVPPNTGFPEGPSEALGLSCHPAQALMPLRRQEVVFELGSEAKLAADTGSGESVQMIAVIEGEDSSSETGGSFPNRAGVAGTGAGQMGSIFQLEGGEGIVIIEVSTSSLTEGAEGVSVGLRHMDKEGTAAQEVASEEQKILETESRVSASVNGT